MRRSGPCPRLIGPSVIMVKFIAGMDRSYNIQSQCVIKNAVRSSDLNTLILLARVGLSSAKRLRSSLSNSFTVAGWVSLKPRALIKVFFALAVSPSKNWLAAKDR